MAGDPDNARLWEDADVYVAFALDTPNPATGADEFGAGWDLVGLLDGEAGFVRARNWDTSDHFAWGNILMKTGRRNFKLTQTFTAFEANETTRRLEWPGSTDESIVVPRPERVKVAFETREGAVVRRLISAYQAEIDVDGDTTENEQDVARLSFIATIYPSSDGVLFVSQESAGS